MIEIKDLDQHVGEAVALGGWVETKRGHGKVAFLVLRDGTGVVQCVLVKKQVDAATWQAYESRSRRVDRTQDAAAVRAALRWDMS